MRMTNPAGTFTSSAMVSTMVCHFSAVRSGMLTTCPGSGAADGGLIDDSSVMIVCQVDLKSEMEGLCTVRALGQLDRYLPDVRVGRNSMSLTPCLKHGSNHQTR